MEMQNRSSARKAAAVLAALSLLCLPVPLKSQQNPVRSSPVGSIADTPSITITTGAANTTYTPTTPAHEVQVQWKFGTVVGTYGTCTVQLQTSFDGTTWLTMGSAAAVTVTTGTVNAWTVQEALGTVTNVQTSTPSATVALGFGQITRGAFSCTTYGTSAPVAINALYK